VSHADTVADPWALDAFALFLRSFFISHDGASRHGTCHALDRNLPYHRPPGEHSAHRSQVMPPCLVLRHGHHRGPFRKAEQLGRGRGLSKHGTRNRGVPVEQMVAMYEDPFGGDIDRPVGPFTQRHVGPSAGQPRPSAGLFDMVADPSDHSDHGHGRTSTDTAVGNLERLAELTGQTLPRLKHAGMHASFSVCLESDDVPRLHHVNISILAALYGWADPVCIDVPVQLRLGFPTDDEAVQLILALAGLTVLVDERTRRYDAAFRALVALDITPAWHDRGGLSFSVREITKLVHHLDPVVVDDELKALWEMVKHPCADNLPATLRARVDTVALEWLDVDGVLHAAPIAPSGIPALLAADVPFVAESDAWRHIEQHATVPVIAGRAQLNGDGFIEIHTNTPQLVEASPLPGLFRLDETHFGMPTPLVAALDAAKGFLWIGDRPLRRRDYSIPASIDITEHVAHAAGELASHLEAFKSACLVWSPGLGRRIAALSALEALDAWPLLVVCEPSSIWLWQRHIELVGKEASFGTTDADARIVTYHDLPRVSIEDPAAVIFDEPHSRAAHTAVAASHRFDALRDMLRIAVCSQWDDDDKSIGRVMELIRPGEFRSQLPTPWRYPLRPSERLREHAESYIFRLAATEVPSGVTARFRRDSIATCRPTTSQAAAFQEVHELFEQGEDPDLLVAMLEEATTAGTGSAPSPKLAETIARVRAAHDKGHTVAVLVGSAKAATRLKMLLRPLRVDLVDEIEQRNPVPADAEVTIVRAKQRIPSLRGFDEVIVCEYPRSFAALDAAVGPAEGPGPQKVTLVHLDNSIDDRLAIHAALARDHAMSDVTPDPVQLLQERT